MYRKRYGVARSEEGGPRYVEDGVPAGHLWTSDPAMARRFEARETALWVADQAGGGARVIEFFDVVDDEASYRQLEGICQEMLVALRIAEAMISGPDPSRAFIRNAIEQAEQVLGVGDKP
jgi:hypothetical protein